MINTIKLLYDMDNQVYYAGSYDMKILWVESPDEAVNVGEGIFDFYGWEIDIMLNINLQLRDYVVSIHNGIYQF